MTTQFACSGIELELFRYPSQQASNLQAWDAADEYLIKYLIDAEITPSTTAILNDNFGALTCALAAQAPNSELLIETDAKTSLLGCQQNLLGNKLAPTNIQWFNSRDTLPDNIQLVLMKLPKNLHYFGQQLARLSTVLPAGTQILIGAKAKSINPALLASIEKNLGPASASLAWKKTRVISCISDGKPRSLAQAVSWNVDELKLTMSNLANVFAANKLDIGARIMLDNMPKGEFNHIIDLGCGNGILGLHAKQCYPHAQIHFVDDSDMAIASAKHNWHANALDAQSQEPQTEQTPQAFFHWDDCLSNLPADVEPDLVLCNPPFHQGEAITDHIAWQMFVDAHKRLKKGGLLHIVGNRHLAYHVKIKRIFKNCTTVASNGKFVILQAIK
ncbi:methyltransferase [Shewanella sp. SR43-4]|uniref:methyltransferase n=1 Tax=Shewanella TaxID=22 RepID=UPI000C5DCDB4|nr:MULTISPECIES: methyltransferase [Shewanella]NCQ46702.1 methyltransferase [Shewanella frigidimarina]MBB1319246.1 methyltransferase [Shewanella sp. SR43-4]NCO71353.1 methyltransferase [Shewanella vesiculosa]NCP37831.1 methyltransferase [Shewanella vesiculosa]NCP70142.1 methyltransferase [Shewanella vesiculosa]